MNIRGQKRSKMADSKPGFLEEMGDFIECPVCLSTITDPPVYMCVRSHIFCEDCHTALKKDNKDCPVCKGELAGNKNITVEKMLDSLPKTQCKNEGCSFKKVDSKKVAIHIEDCKYRLVKCIHCKADVPLNNMSEHLWDVHKAHKVEGNLAFGKNYSSWWSLPLEVADGTSIPLQIEENGKVRDFFLRRVVQDDGHHLRWISHSESKKDTRKYKYTINFQCGKAYDEGKVEALLTHVGFCTPPDTTDAMMDPAPCMFLPKDFLKQNLDKEKKYRFEWRIDVL